MFCLYVARSSTNRPSLSAHCSSPHISLARAPPSLPRLSSIWQCPSIFEPRRPSFNRWQAESVASAIDIVHHINIYRRYDLSMFRRRRPADVRCQRSNVGANRSNASNLFTPRRRVGVAMRVRLRILHPFILIASSTLLFNCRWSAANPSIFGNGLAGEIFAFGCAVSSIWLPCVFTFAFNCKAHFSFSRPIAK